MIGFKKRIILVSGLAIGALLIFYLFFFRESRDNVIYINENGCSPAGLVVKAGSPVTFVNQNEVPVWPASDLHPALNLYPEFNPGEAIAPGKTWQFVFEKTGTWRYHDHLDPEKRGTILVVSRESFIDNLPEESEVMGLCLAKENRDEQLNCWTDYFESVASKKGSEVALEIIKRFKEQDAAFASDCHTVVHTVGEVAYWLYSKNGKLPESGIVSVCGYGFIHGFMQEFGHHDINFTDKVVPTCDHFVNQISYADYEKTVEPIDQCYHGAGHGLLFLYFSDYWDNEAEIVRRGAEDCRALSNDSRIVSNCVYGLFGGIGELYTGGHGYKKELDPADPFKLCRVQENNLKEACYDSFLPVTWVYAKNDIEKTLAYYAKVEERQFLGQAMYNFGDIISHDFWRGLISEKETLAACRSLEPGLYERCLFGFAEGVIRNGLPETAYGKALDFCALVPELETGNQCIEAANEEAKLNQLIGPND